MAAARVTPITKILSRNARSLASSAPPPTQSWSTVQRRPLPGGTQTGGVVETWKQFNYGKLSFDATHIVSATAFTVESPWGRT